MKNKNQSKDAGSTDKKPGQPAAEEAAEKGKKAIDAALVADGKDPGADSTRKEEEKDADRWRSEG